MLCCVSVQDQEDTSAVCQFTRSQGEQTPLKRARSFVTESVSPFIFPHTRSRPPLTPAMPTLPEEEEDSPEELDSTSSSPSTVSLTIFFTSQPWRLFISSQVQIRLFTVGNVLSLMICSNGTSVRIDAWVLIYRVGTLCCFHLKGIFTPTFSLFRSMREKQLGSGVQLLWHPLVMEKKGSQTVFACFSDRCSDFCTCYGDQETRKLVPDTSCAIHCSLAKSLMPPSHSFI